MSMLRFPLAMLAIAALSSLGSLQAQVTQTKPAPAQPNTTQPNTTQPNATQPNATRPNATRPNATRPNATQLNTTQRTPQTQPAQQTPTQQQPNQRPGQVRANGNANQQAGVSVKQALVKKLQKANQAEIELATMAEEKTNNPELKKFAKMMIEDHQACNEKLQAMASSPAAGRQQSSDSKEAANAQARQQPSNSNEAANSQTRQQPNNNSEVANTEARQQPGMNAARGRMVPQQLCQVMDQATDNALQMTKKMLQGHEGQDFEVAFLRQQCMAHMMMLAELKAIESNGPKDMKAFATETIAKVEQHLEKAKQLVKAMDTGTKKQG